MLALWGFSYRPPTPKRLTLFSQIPAPRFTARPLAGPPFRFAGPKCSSAVPVLVSSPAGKGTPGPPRSGAFFSHCRRECGALQASWPAASSPDGSWELERGRFKDQFTWKEEWNFKLQNKGSALCSANAEEPLKGYEQQMCIIKKDNDSRPRLVGIRFRWFRFLYFAVTCFYSSSFPSQW